MKLNHDLIRELLLLIEKEKEFNNPILSADFSKHHIFKKYKENDIIYTLHKLKEENYIYFSAYYGDGLLLSYVIGDLTMKGHNFLDSIRDDKIWRETKEQTNKLKGVPINIISSVASKLIEVQLGI